MKLLLISLLICTIINVAILIYYVYINRSVTVIKENERVLYALPDGTITDNYEYFLEYMDEYNKKLKEAIEKKEGLANTIKDWILSNDEAQLFFYDKLVEYEKTVIKPDFEALRKKIEDKKEER